MSIQFMAISSGRAATMESSLKGKRAGRQMHAKMTRRTVTWNGARSHITLIPARNQWMVVQAPATKLRLHVGHTKPPAQVPPWTRPLLLFRRWAIAKRTYTCNRLADSIMSRTCSSALLGAFQSLRISLVTAPLRASLAHPARSAPTLPALIAGARPFSSTAANQSWLEPRIDRKKKMMKGRPRVPTGGSVKGTTVMWGDYGLRMKDHDRRISAKQLKRAEDAIKNRMRGQKYRLYKRVCCNIGVFTSGNEVSPP